MAARLQAVALALAAAAGPSPALAASSSGSSASAASLGPLDCPRARTALTSACLGRCYSGRPCVAYAGANATSASAGGQQEEEVCEASALSACTSAEGDVCALECFTNGPDDFVAQDAVGFSAYTFLVPLAGDATTGDTDEHPSKSNQVLQRIEALELLDVTTKVTIVGGTSADGAGKRGNVAKMELAGGFLASNTQLEHIMLANLGLEEIAAGLLPTANVTNLTLANCLLTDDYPDDLVTMGELVRLDLSRNYLTTFPARFSLPQLEQLNLSSNNLVSYYGDLSALTSLDLSNNKLSEIPASVFASSQLQKLYLGGNSFESVTLAESELAFLENLQELSIDSFGDISHCSNAAAVNGTDSSTGVKLVTISGVNVCAVVSSTSASADGQETTITSIGSSSSSTNVAAIAGTAAGGLVVVLVLIFALVVYVKRERRRERMKFSRHPTWSLGDSPSDPIDGAFYRQQSEGGASEVDHTVKTVLRDHPSLLSLRIEASELHTMTDSFARGSRYVIDLASFRHVRRSIQGIEPPEFIAVKRLRLDDLDNVRYREEFLTELSLLARLQHPHITPLLGIMYSRRRGVQALIEFMEGGTLRSWLSGLLDAGETSAWTPIKSLLALDMAEALAFAHSFSPPLVHARLRSDKVFLTRDARGKLGHWREFQSGGRNSSDFDGGMATVHLPGHGQSERWMAPEVLKGSAEYSPASDVFALGVILSEMDTHLLPYTDTNPNLDAFDAEMLALVSSGRLRPAFSTNADGIPWELRIVAQRCLVVDPRARATALDVVRTLKAGIASGW